MRVLVAMSGGVDSSTSAALLKSAGHEVLGVSMRVFDRPDPERGCCRVDHLQDAREAARLLDVPFFVVDLRDLFERTIIDHFVDEYVAGRTPNPCVVCNDELKFGWLLRHARSLGAKLATGHYARVERRGDLWVLRASTHDKDQSYFLHRLGQDALRDVLFPLGGMSKSEVRELARRFGLPVADKPDSQEICFVTKGGAGDFVERRAVARVRPGEVVSTTGEVLARHEGIHRFTVGQRRGLGLPGGGPHYVARIEPATARVVVGPDDVASRSRFRVEAVRWVAGSAPPSPLTVLVRVRHRHTGEVAIVEPRGDEAEVVLASPVRGVAPGQAAVFYLDDEVLGGGRIAVA